MIYDRDSMKRFGAAVGASALAQLDPLFEMIAGNAGLEGDKALLEAFKLARARFEATLARDRAALEATL